MSEIETVFIYMGAKKLFFFIRANQPHFKVKIIFNFVRANETSEDD